MKQTINVSDNQRLFFVSDVHGCLDELKEALDNVNFTDNDVVICAGDLIDRGPDSMGTVLFFEAHKNMYCVRGNHDQFSVDDDFANWIYNGGGWILDQSQDDLRYMTSILKKMPFLIKVNYKDKSIGVVHAGFPRGIYTWGELEHFIEDKFMDAIWTRDMFSRNSVDMSPIPDIEYVIHGHTPVNEPQFIGNRLYIDTGCAYGRKLTLAEFNGESFNFTYVDNKHRSS